MCRELWMERKSDGHQYTRAPSQAPSLPFQIGAEINLNLSLQIERDIFIPSYYNQPIKYWVGVVFPYNQDIASEGFSSHILSIYKLIFNPIFNSSTHRILGESFTWFFSKRAWYLLCHNWRWRTDIYIKSNKDRIQFSSFKIESFLVGVATVNSDAGDKQQQKIQIGLNNSIQLGLIYYINVAITILLTNTFTYITNIVVWFLYLHIKKL